MDIGSIATGLAAGSVAQSLDVGVLKALQNLDANVTAEMMASIGVGNFVDAKA